MSISNKDETISVAQAARHLRVAAGTVLRYRESGLLRGCQVTPRGWWRISKESVLQLEARLQRQMSEGD